MLVRDGLWVLERINDYDGRRVFTIVAIIELRDGKMWRDIRYYAEPFEAPEWRAKWAESTTTPRANKRPATNTRVPSRAALVNPVRFPGRPWVSPDYPLGSLHASLAGLA